MSRENATHQPPSRPTSNTCNDQGVSQFSPSHAAVSWRIFFTPRQTARCKQQSSRCLTLTVRPESCVRTGGVRSQPPHASSSPRAPERIAPACRIRSALSSGLRCPAWNLLPTAKTGWRWRRRGRTMTTTTCSKVCFRSRSSLDASPAASACGASVFLTRFPVPTLSPLTPPSWRGVQLSSSATRASASRTC